MQTDLEHGDKFRFLGLSKNGQPSNDDRTITILGISVTGELAIRIDLDTPPRPDYHNNPSVSSCSYDTALRMIEQGIWQHIDKKES